MAIYKQKEGRFPQETQIINHMAKIILEPGDFVRHDESGALGIVLHSDKVLTLERTNPPFLFSCAEMRITGFGKLTLIQTEDIPADYQTTFLFARKVIEKDHE